MKPVTQEEYDQVVMQINKTVKWQEQGCEQCDYCKALCNECFQDALENRGIHTIFNG